MGPLLCITISPSFVHHLALLSRTSCCFVGLICLLFFAEKRWGVLSRFFAERRTALDLGVFRVSLMVALLIQIRPEIVLHFAQLDAALVVPPTGWGWFASAIPREPMLVAYVIALFYIGTILALLGAWTRVTVVASVATAFYLMTVMQLFGKINHCHDLVLGGILLAVSPCGDALSLDAIVRARGGSRIPMFAERRRYAAPLNGVILLLCATYFFPGAWKILSNGFRWFTPGHLHALIVNKLAESTPNSIQRWVLDHSLLLVLGACFTIAFEMGWSLLAIPRRTRPLAVVVGLGFHNMTNLLMNIPFWNLQFLYVVLIDWGALLGHFSNRVRSARIAARDWSSSQQDRRVRDAAPLFTNLLAGGFVTGMVITGLLRIGGGWPVACFPTFDDPSPVPTAQLVTIQGTTTDGGSYEEILSVDPILQKRFQAEIWRGMMEAMGCPNQFDTAARERAVGNLWSAAHPDIHLRYATLYCDVYSGGVDTSHRVSRRVLDVVDMSGISHWSSLDHM